MPDLVSRIVRAYRATFATYGNDEPVWSIWLGHFKNAEHAILQQGTAAECGALLRDPSQSLLHYGFDEICRQDPALRHGTTHIVSEPDWIYDLIRRTAEAVGSVRLQFPELMPGTPDSTPDIEHILALLDTAFGFRIEFPNPFAHESGLSTTRGVASFRAVQSLYQAWRMNEVLRTKGRRRIAEIGGGLGRTAFYARQFGFESYTIVDIPLSAAAQANYLGRVLPAESWTTFGEEAHGGNIALRPPTAFLDDRPDYDLIVNFDGLTEQPPASATDYWRFAHENRIDLLSVNHEANPTTFRSLYLAADDSTFSVARHPFWLRRGYVDELISFNR